MADQVKFNSKRAKHLEAIHSTEYMVNRRRRCLELLELSTGQEVLDIGSGLGIFTEELAEVVGHSGQVVGIDISKDMLTMARHRCSGRSNIRFEEADALQLPFADASFDAAVAAQVYEYVSDVSTALGELRRVLRPGARVILVDVDWASLVWEAEDRPRAAKLFDASNEHCADPYLPRRLHGLLSDAGFEVGLVEPFPIFSRSLDFYVASLANLVAGFVAGRRGVTAEDAAAWLQDLNRTEERGASFFCITLFLFAGLRR
jgi:arsenite methyltransferase